MLYNIINFVFQKAFNDDPGNSMALAWLDKGVSFKLHHFKQEVNFCRWTSSFLRIVFYF